MSTSAAAALALGVGVATSILPNAQSPAQASPLHGVSIALDPKMAQQLEENCSNAPLEDAAPDDSRVLTLKHAEDRGTFTVGWLESASGEKFTCLDYLSTAYGSATDPSITRYEATLLDGTKLSGTVFDGQLLIVSDQGDDLGFTSQLLADGLTYEMNFGESNLASIELYHVDGSSSKITKELDGTSGSSQHSITTEESTSGN